MREGETFYQHFVKFKSVEKLAFLEVPYDNIGLFNELYLKSHIGFLSSGDISSRRWYLDNCDVIVVSTQEILRTRKDMTNHDRRAQRKYDMFIIRVK